MPENETLELWQVRQICALVTSLETQGRMTAERAQLWRDYARKNCPSL